MIDRIVDFSARHYLLVLTLAGVAAFLGWRSMTLLPLDALPELGDKQVIVYSQWDRSPEQIEAHVTNPIVSTLLGAPRVKAVRGNSEFGVSFVHVIFDDDTDLYWARSRTLEYLSSVLPRLPEGVKTELGPDATALGWIYQYVLVDTSKTRTPAELRSYQDWHLKYALKAVPGVAEVASVGGFVRQYQVNVDPNRLRAYGLSIDAVVDAVKHGNADVGGKVVESAGAELIVRSIGSASSLTDLEQMLVETADDGTPIQIRDVARVSVGTEARRGAADLDGTGEVVSGIVVMRPGENALTVIDRVKTRIRELESTLPTGVRVIGVYDRSDLVRRAITTLKSTILEVTITVAMVILVFLWHPPSAAVPLITIPIAVLIAFIPFRWLGIDANIMSLAGIAIAVGALVDAAIVIVEQTYKRLAEWERDERRGDPRQVMVETVQRMARPSFYALLVIAVSFLPLLMLQGEAGRLFRPLAYAKSLAMVVAATLAITLTPALLVLLMRFQPLRFRPAWVCTVANALLVGRFRHEGEHPITRSITRMYEPLVAWSLSHKRAVVGGAVVAVVLSVPVWQRLGTEFMPRFDEGVMLYMPSVMPGISIGEAQRLLRATDEALKLFPEVEHVLGKSGRAETATDLAPVSMFETIVVLRPQSEWRRIPTWYSSWAPEWLKTFCRRITPDHISREDLVREMNRAVTVPGLANTWSMPIRGRVDMLATGIRTPIGIKISGSHVEEIQRIGEEVATLLSSVNGARGVFSERVGQGYFLDLRWNRDALARAGLSIENVQGAVRYGIGGDNVGVIFEGRERYPVNVRLGAPYRGDPQAVPRVLVRARDGRQIPLGDLAEVRRTAGPVMLRNEGGFLTGYVYIDLAGTEVAEFVARANRALRDFRLPEGYRLSWSGQYEAIVGARHQLVQVVTLCLLVVIVLLYASTRSVIKTLIVLLAAPFSLIGAVWTLYLLGYNVSIAVWVGLVALIGVDAGTGVFMLLYLDEAYDRARRRNSSMTLADLNQAVLDGAARRVRPKFMTVMTLFMGLLPIMLSMGAGSDVMKRIAAPMIGGILTSFILELIVYPPVYYSWRSRTLPATAAKREPL